MKEKLDKLLKLELNELDKLDLEKELSNLKLTSHKIYQEYLLEKHEKIVKKTWRLKLIIKGFPKYTISIL